MKIKVDILLGFLNSGKTTLINLFLESGEIEDESVVIIEYEDGEEKVIQQSKNVHVIYRKVSNNFDEELLSFILREYIPDRIIIEYNSAGKTKEFIHSFENKYINKICVINRIISIINMRRSAIYFFDMKSRLSDQIKNSHVVTMNNLVGIDKIMVKKMKNHIGKLNKSIKIIEFIDKECEREAIENRKLCLNTYDEKLSKEEILILIFVIIFFMAIILCVPLSESIENVFIQ